MGCGSRNVEETPRRRDSDGGLDVCIVKTLWLMGSRLVSALVLLWVSGAAVAPAGATEGVPRGVPRNAVELTEHRTLLTKQFQVPGHGYVAVVSSRPQHWLDNQGKFQDIVTAFRAEKDGSYTADGLPFIVRVVTSGAAGCPAAPGVASCLLIGDRAGRNVVAYPLPGRALVKGHRARFRFDGMTCDYGVTDKGVKLGCAVKAPRGPHQYTFPYRLLGQASQWHIDADGAARNNIATVAAPVVIGADQQFYAAGSWSLAGPDRLAFDFDDSQLPAAAFPYTLDPTTTFNLGICCTSADGTTCAAPATYCTTSSTCTTAPYTVCAGASGSDAAATGKQATYPPNFTSCNSTSGYLQPERSLSGGDYTVTVPLIKWDTSALPDNATVTDASVVMYSFVQPAPSRTGATRIPAT